MTSENRPLAVGVLVTDDDHPEDLLSVADGLLPFGARRLTVGIRTDSSPFLLNENTDLDGDRGILEEVAAAGETVGASIEQTLAVGDTPLSGLVNCTSLVLSRSGLASLETPLFDSPPCTVIVVPTGPLLADLETVAVHVTAETALEPTAMVARSIAEASDATVQVVNTGDDRLRAQRSLSTVSEVLGPVDVDPRIRSEAAAETADLSVVMGPTDDQSAVVVAPEQPVSLRERLQGVWQPAWPIRRGRSRWAKRAAEGTVIR